ncbi:MAG: SDR family NAD(P)-dependent oxidoreductase [Alphaproteobacteria bacterium]|nr:SDR family NAD(P)-dependent oxidoreductase [Alphaproteobacteria bacterium]MDP6565269.1 SDR family NAD(P)-dependent oxidoreductase [Alphaproteobacteria bacterium]MDP6813398.1 SDR family NAD(P)-dependent oxidoreductase [Alphaproteobacteria bacterium]
MRDPETILITGASSGIGAALARAYAGRCRLLALTGRDAGRLAAVAADCRAAGAEVVDETVDVVDRRRMADLIGRIDERAPIDLVVANAGIDGAALAGDERFYGTMEVNLIGVLNTVLPAISPMQRRGRGQIAVISSLAGYRGMPGAVAYGASKAAVRSLGEGLRGRLAASGIAVSVVTPGFVESRITASNTFPMPFQWSAERAAERIRRDLARNRGRIAFPWPLYAGVWLLNVLPSALADAITARSPRKG